MTGNRGGNAKWLEPLLRTGVLAILDSGICGELSRMVSTAKKLSMAGIGFFQLRAKGMADAQMVSWAINLRRALPESVITINDRCDIAEVAGVQGVHLGAGDLSVSAARGILSPGRLVGSSAGDLREMGLAVSARPDYLSIGPAFATKTKRDAGEALRVSGFAGLRQKAPKGLPVLAVGGINPDNTGRLVNAGADAVAVASLWFRCRNPERAAREMLEAVVVARKKKSAHGALSRR